VILTGAALYLVVSGATPSTEVAAIFLGCALGITFVLGWNTDPVKFFGEAAAARS
jgi:hypothetical protein